MVDTLEPKPGFAFWVIGAVALVWNLFGLMLYVMQVSATPEQLAAAYTPEQVELLLAVPAWATSMTAIATTAGVLGCLLLLLRKRLAVPLFGVSLVALVLQDLYTFVLADTLAVFGSQPLIIQVVVFVVALFLLGYSRRAAADRLLM
jgi:hypothetical protein